MVKFHPCLSYGKPMEEKLPFSYMNESVYERKGPLEIRHFGSFYILLKSQQSEFFFLLKLFQAFGFGRSLNCSVLTHHVRVGQLRTTLLQHREVNCHFWPESEGTNCAWAESWLLESKHSVMDGTTSEYCRRLFTDHLRAPGQLKEEKWIRPW